MGKSSRKNRVAPVSTQSSSKAHWILIGVLAVVLIGVLVVVTMLVAQKNRTTQPEGTIAGTKAVTGYSEPATFDSGRGIWIKGGKMLNNEEITAEMENDPTVVELYYDYTCNFCNDLEQAQSAAFERFADDGKQILVLRPTLTHAGPLAAPGNNVFKWLIENQPEKALAFNAALQAFTAENLNSQASTDDAAFKQAYEEPLKVIQDAAEKAGVTLPDNLEEIAGASPTYGEAAINALAQTRASTLGIQPATPLVIVDGKPFELTDYKTNKNLFDSIG